MRKYPPIWSTAVVSYRAAHGMPERVFWRGGEAVAVGLPSPGHFIGRV